MRFVVMMLVCSSRSASASYHIIKLNASFNKIVCDVCVHTFYFFFCSCVCLCVSECIYICTEVRQCFFFNVCWSKTFFHHYLTQICLLNHMSTFMILCIRPICCLKPCRKRVFEQLDQYSYFIKFQWPVRDVTIRNLTV